MGIGDVRPILFFFTLKKSKFNSAWYGMGISDVRPISNLVDSTAVLHGYRVAYVGEFSVLCVCVCVCVCVLRVCVNVWIVDRFTCTESYIQNHLKDEEVVKNKSPVYSGFV